MKLTVFTVKDISFRYGDENSVNIKRFSTEELCNEYFDYQVNAMKKIADLTEYEPNCFEDSNHKWAYEFFKYKEEIEIVEEKDWKD